MKEKVQNNNKKRSRRGISRLSQDGKCRGNFMKEKVMNNNKKGACREIRRLSREGKCRGYIAVQYTAHPPVLPRNSPNEVMCLIIVFVWEEGNGKLWSGQGGHAE